MWREAFDGYEGNSLIIATRRIASLRSLKKAVDEDLLVRVEDLVMADAFGSLLEQADHLISKCYSLAAGVLGRAVLKEHLRKLCDRNGCLPTGRPTINDLNQELYKNSHLDKIAVQNVTAMAATGNHCSHNVHPKLSDADVKKFLDDVRTFLGRHPLP